MMDFVLPVVAFIVIGFALFKSHKHEEKQEHVKTEARKRIHKKKTEQNSDQMWYDLEKDDIPF